MERRWGGEFKRIRSCRIRLAMVFLCGAAWNEKDGVTERHEAQSNEWSP